MLVAVRRKTAGGKNAVRHKKAAGRRQYRAGSYPDAVHPSSSRLRRDKAAERWSPKAKVRGGTKKPPQGGKIAPGRTRTRSIRPRQGFAGIRRRNAGCRKAKVPQVGRGAEKRQQDRQSGVGVCFERELLFFVYMYAPGCSGME